MLFPIVMAGPKSPRGKGIMSKGEKPFRSGHTAALDLDQIEKEEEDGWSVKPKKGKWASKDWSGGLDEFPDVGAKPGTAALDISDFEGLDEGDAPWVEEMRDEGRPKGKRGARPNSDFSDFENKGNTLALDLEDFDAPQEDAFEMDQRRRAVRNEDARDPHDRDSQRGRKSYKPGRDTPQQRGPLSRRDSDNESGRDGDSRDSSNSWVNDLAEVRDDSEVGELMPHEATMAISLEEVKDIAAGPERDRPIHKKSGGVGDLKPHEATIALSVEGLDEETLIEPQSEGPDRKKLKIDASKRGLSTSVIDKKDIESFRLKEASSGGRLLIFVPGNEPILFDLRPGVTSVGRARTNHLVLADPSCSRKHLRIKKKEDHFVVRDNGGDSGTIVNRTPLPGQVDHEIRHGDDIIVGSTVMRLVIGEARPNDYITPTAFSVDRPGGVQPDDLGSRDERAHAHRSNNSSLVPIILTVLFIVALLATMLTLVIIFFWPGGVF